MQQETRPPQASIARIGEAATVRGHPGAVGFGHDAGNLAAARRQLDHEQDGDARQPTTGPDVDREEIRRREGLRVCGQGLGRARLRQVATIVTPDTMLWWHRQLIARKSTHARGMAQRRGRVVAVTVKNVKRATAMPSIAERILPASTVYTDEYPVYNPLGPVNGYQHHRILPAEKVYVSGDVHTNTIEGCWSLVKRGIGGASITPSPRNIYEAISTSTRGATTSNTSRAADSNRYFFGPRLTDFPGVAAFFRSLKKSPRFGTGMSVPFWLFCIRAF